MVRFHRQHRCRRQLPPPPPPSSSPRIVRTVGITSKEKNAVADQVTSFLLHSVITPSFTGGCRHMIMLLSMIVVIMVVNTIHSMLTLPSPLLLWRHDLEQQQHQTSLLSIVSTSTTVHNKLADTINNDPKIAFTNTSPQQMCLVHEPIYVPNVVLHPRKKKKKNSHVDSSSGSINTNITTGEYMTHPSPVICGTLRRTIWKTGYTIEYKDRNSIKNDNTTDSYVLLSNLAYEIEQQQSNCSLPIKLFHIDNQNGFGAHVHLWSQAYCNSVTVTDNDVLQTQKQRQQLYRLKTYNPDWLWKDQTYCGKHNPVTTTSPWTCYFPKMEDRCPHDNDDIMSIDSISTYNIPNVTSPYRNVDRCVSLQWPNPKTKNKPHRITKDDQDNNDDSTKSFVSNYISEYRAATTEFIFQSINPLIVQEAERQIGILFSDTNNNENDDPNRTIMVPPDLITVHLRWGDKFFEMDLVSIEEYMTAILDMLHIIHNNNNDDIQKNDSSIGNTTTAHIYLACEDPKAVLEFLNYTQYHYPHWKVYVDRSITELQLFRPNVGNRASYMTKNTNGRGGLLALGSLLVSMESQYYILTTGSNWSRIMNELRLNVIEKRCCNNNSNDDDSHKPCTHMIDLRPGEW